jgi:ligand-binding SRPBCC domain-containing protein
VWHKLTSQVTVMDRPAYFRDKMERGIFRYMRHDHFFWFSSPDETEMRDIFCFAAPVGILARLAEIMVLRRYMQALLRERNAVLRDIAESSAWREYLPSTPETEGAGPNR